MKESTFVEDHKTLVSTVEVSGDLEVSVRKAVDLLGGFNRVISKGDRVIVKPNFNSPVPFPATSDPEFVKVVVSLLYEAGAAEVIIVESAGYPWLPTSQVFRKTGMVAAAQECGAKLKALDEGEWIKVDVRGSHLKKLWVAREVIDGARLLLLPCMKTHRRARFSLSLKLGLGVVRPKDRKWLHLSRLEEKVAELNTAFQPDLIIMDARKCIVTDGPNEGVVREPALILASQDRVAIDVEALKVLKAYGEHNRLEMPLWELPQIRRAVELGLGVKGESEIKVVR